MIRVNRNVLKYTAAATMLIDHIGMIFLPITTIPGLLCRIVGRFAAPTMCFFLAEGFAHTSSKKKYGIRLFLFALISQVPYTLAQWDDWLKLDLNMGVTLFLSFLALLAYDGIPESNIRWIVIGGLVGASFIADWGIFGPLFVLAFYINRGDRRAVQKAYLAVALGVVLMETVTCIAQGAHWYGELWQLGLLSFLPVPYLYNGESGSKAAFHRWFFYLFYPLHLLVLWWIAYRC